MGKVKKGDSFLKGSMMFITLLSGGDKWTCIRKSEQYYLLKILIFVIK